MSRPCGSSPRASAGMAGGAQRGVDVPFKPLEVPMGARHLSTLLCAGLGLLATTTTFALAFVPGAPPCGGVVPCACGDRVVTSRTLTPADPVTTTVCTGNGLFVGPGVTLDLGGRTITGDGAGIDAGITIEGGANNVVIRGGRVTGFFTGITTFTSTTGSTLTDLQIISNGAGINISASDTTVTKSVIRRNEADCLFVLDGPALQDLNTVTLNRCEDNGGTGLVVTGVLNTIARNVLLRNGGSGADINGEGHTIDRNQSKYNGGAGYEILGQNHRVTLNIAQSNGADGFAVSAEGSTFERNSSSYNGRAEDGQPADGYGIHDTSTDGGTGGTANFYSANNCTGNGLGDSSPAGLCQ